MRITISNFLGGFLPGYWKSDYPSFGNKNMAGKMKNVDLTDPSFMTQGPGLTTIDDEEGNVSTNIKSILDRVTSSNNSYAIGGNKFYTITATSVAAPHTINHASYTGEDGEDLEYLGGNIYYTYNHSGGGDIGKYDGASTYDDDWGSTTPTGHTSLGDHPHPITSSKSILYVGNGHYVTSYNSNNDTLVEDDLDIPSDEEIVDLELSGSLLYVASNSPNVSGSNKNYGSIYKWDRYYSSWEDDSIFGIGEIGGMINKNGIIWVFHKDLTSGGYNLGYISGKTIKDIGYYDGSLPQYNQISIYKNFIVWVSDNKIYAFGSPSDNNINLYLFSLMDGGYSTVGGIGNPFGDLLIASTQSTNYKLAKAANYTTDAYWKSKLFDVSEGDLNKSMIDKVIVNFDTIESGARVDATLDCDYGGNSVTKEISYTSDGAAYQKIWKPRVTCRNFRIEFDWSEGSTTKPVKIRNVKIIYHHV